ncbi:MAG: chemotaxis response regulator protein-glutamate methylesterase [Spirochaetales bacterium]|nr:chemotaxis response regulator protein-glutamate methylesterase [Spirochaetales bacterium]
MNKVIRVLIVDDSAVVRELLTEQLGKEDDIEIIGTAPDPYIARNKIVAESPDVITLDIEMPRMDGLTFLQKLITYYPIPAIIVSSVTAKDAAASIKALEIGAFDIVNKPGGAMSTGDIAKEIAYKIRMAYKVRHTFLTRRKLIASQLSTQKAVSRQIISGIDTTDKLIAIGASTGGTVALEHLLSRLPSNLPPVLIVQHMPPGYTKAFAGRLNEICSLRIKESEDGEIVQAGTVYIAKGGVHLRITRKGSSIYLSHDNSERVHYQRPAVDVLFNSVAETAGKNTMGILLTGMGSDGAKGLKGIKNAGGITVAQDEESSIVWGMPLAAIEMGAHSEILSLLDIPERIISYAKQGR